ncbi:MAG TPA: penicillin-binding protein [Parasegetibacter sp.]
MNVKRDILWRVYLCFLVMIIFSVLVLGKAFYLQHIEGDYWRSLGDSLHQRFEELSAERGTIYSADGSMLSTSVPEFDIYIDFAADGLREKGGKRFTENLDSLAYCLSALFKDQNKAAYKRQLELGYRKKSRYYPLKKKVSFSDYQQLRAFPLVRQGRNKSGFIVEVRTKRLTPFGLLANRTIGLARENAQNVGLERTYDSVLRGTTGRRLVRQVAGGAFIPVEGTEIEPEKGKDIITTIDVNIQDITETALHKMLIENEATHGTCIVMEVKTGKIKAIANLARQPDGSYWESFNYAITASEPGSTFKLATLLALLEDKFVTLDHHVNLEGGAWKIGNRTVFDSERHNLTEVTLKKAFEQSSNVGMAKLASTYYGSKPEDFVKHLRRLHLDQVSGIDLLGESNPIIKTPANKSWSATTLPWMSFGYEVMISPLQTLMIYNAVANNGRMMKPYLVSEIVKDGITISKKEPVVLEEKVCSPETLKQLKEALEGVMINGTGKSISSPEFTMAGKTGTALVANGRKGYSERIYQSSFAGYFPADDPVYSCIVVIKNKPFAKKFYGASVAGPVFKEIAGKLYALQVEDLNAVKTKLKKDSSSFSYAGHVEDINRVFTTLGAKVKVNNSDSDWSVVSNKDDKIVLTGKEVGKNIIPDVKGMGLKDAIYLLENLGIRVITRGAGKVKSQSIDPGTPLSKGQTIYLELM